MRKLLFILLFFPAAGFCQDTLPYGVPRYFTIDGPCNPCVEYPPFVTGCRWFTLLDDPEGGMVHLEAVSPRPAYFRVDSAHLRVVHDTVGMVGPVMSGMQVTWVRGGWSGYSFEVGGTYGDSLWISTTHDIQMNPVQVSSRDLCDPLWVPPGRLDSLYYRLPFFTPTDKLEGNSKYKRL